MPAEGHITVEIRLPAAEHELLKRHALPSMTAWVRTEIRKLPGGSDLPPLKTAAVLEPPKWPPEPLYPGDKPGLPSIQIQAFVAAVKGISREKFLWRRWLPVHGLYEGLRAILARGDGLKSVWSGATRWRRSGEPPHPSRELYEALFKFVELRAIVKEWYNKKYKISNSKRHRAKQKDPEGFLARQRKYTADYRARQKASAAAQEKSARERATYEDFTSEHVTEHGVAADPLPVAAE